MVAVIDRATKSDLSGIREIEESVEGRNAASMVTLRERLSTFPEGFLVARVRGLVVGYLASCTWNRDHYTTFEELRDFKAQHDPKGKYLYVIYVCVAKEFRRRKIATRLLQEVERVAREKGVREIHLVSKRKVISLYTKLGFEKIEELPEFVEGLNGVLVKKRL